VACSTVATSGFLMSTPKDRDARASGDRTFFGNATISNLEYASPARPGLWSVFLSSGPTMEGKLDHVSKLDHVHPPSA